MKTWRIRVLTSDGQPLSLKHAFARYLLCWLWFMPGLALAKMIDAHGWMLVLMPTGNIIAWALTIYLDPQRQFLHDRLARTSLVKVAPLLSKTAPRPVR
jgi:uncharacterized RDD family membrane protein YckC